MPLFKIFSITFPAIRGSSSQTSIVVRPGFLFRGINRHAMKASNNLFADFIFLLGRFLIKSAIHFRRSEEVLQNELEVNICIQ